MRDLFLSRVPRAALPVLCVVIAASGACSGSHTADDPAPVDGGRSDAASRDLNTARDLPVIDTDGGGSEVCGSTVCRPGQVCCNESCGICAAEGESCPAIACVDAGGPCVGCAPPPEGCRYVGGTCETCGELVCEDTSCGGFVGRMCGAEEYCNYAEGCGFDDGGGTCAPRPQACDRDCPGVCGCDGRSYCNACEAASEGVDVQHNGECARPPEPMDLCGTLIGGTCDRSEWCDYGRCPGPDEAGVCRPRPDACNDIFDPVCGCNGQQYPNQCEARRAGQNISSRGPCPR